MIKKLLLPVAILLSCSGCSFWFNYGDKIPNINPPHTLNLHKVPRKIICLDMGGIYFPRRDDCERVDY